MQITSYQMHNALECYGKKLGQARKSQKPLDGLPPKSMGGEILSTESSRQATMEKISQQVLDKVADAVAISRESREMPPEQAAEVNQPEGEVEPAEARFTYNVMDSINRKHTASISAGDSATLIRRLDKMAEKTVASKTESWV